MRIVIAPDSFKESLTAPDAAEAIVAGFREIFPAADYCLCPLADGGEGTAAALTAATGGTLVPVTVTGPLGDQLAGFYGLSGDGMTAVVEMAVASGLALVPPHLRNPLVTTSFGTGELILAALAAGVKRLIVGIGGSATNDGGAGMLQALGMRFLDSDGEELGYGGGELARLERVDGGGLDPRLQDVSIEVACDVSNPLAGENGASAVYGPQKGATPEMVVVLDDNLERFARILKRDLGKDVAMVPGAGAAGGMGAALLALGGELCPGIDIIMAAVGLEAAIREADLVITGEGKLDGQTAQGKVVSGVARLAQRHGRPAIAICGGLGAGAETVHDVAALFSATPLPCTLDEALATAAENLHRTARNVAAAIAIGLRIG